jgi:TetR/AcrR family transcriptional regulator
MTAHGKNPAPVRWGPGQPAPEEVQDQKRRAIVSAAAALFNEYGYNGTALADVSERLGLTKQAIYYYYKDKQSLLFACSLQAHKGAVELFAQEPATGLRSGRERLTTFLERYALYVVNGNFQSVMFLDSREFTAEQVKQLLALRHFFDEGIRKMIAEGIRDGSLRRCDPKFASMALLGAVNWIARWYRADGKLPIQEVATQIVRHAIGGIAPAEQVAP